jgi:ABC-type dipeptide/oligopeptide/nickel transport system permease component
VIAGYILRRLAFLPLTLLLVAFATFIVLRLTGNPVDIFLDINRTPEQVEALTKRLHLDQPLPVQF